MAIAVSLVSTHGAKAQTRSVNLELLGSSGMAGVNYDARFKGSYGFGYSAGLGYGYSKYTSPLINQDLYVS